MLRKPRVLLLCLLYLVLCPSDRRLHGERLLERLSVDLLARLQSVHQLLLFLLLEASEVFLALNLVVRLVVLKSLEELFLLHLGMRCQEPCRQCPWHQRRSLHGHQLQLHLHGSMCRL